MEGQVEISKIYLSLIYVLRGTEAIRRVFHLTLSGVILRTVSGALLIALKQLLTLRNDLLVRDQRRGWSG